MKTNLLGIITVDYDVRGRPWPHTLHSLHNYSQSEYNAAVYKAIYRLQATCSSVREVKVKVMPYSFFKLGARWGVGCQRQALTALPPGKTRYPLYRRLGGPQGRSELVRKISPPPDTWIRSPDRPARTESLYRLSYPGPPVREEVLQNTVTEWQCPCN